MGHEDGVRDFCLVQGGVVGAPCSLVGPAGPGGVGGLLFCWKGFDLMASSFEKARSKSLEEFGPCRYLLDWCYGGKCCADPPVMSKTEMTKGLSVFFSDNMRRLDHIANICWFSQIRRCANLRSWIKLPM